MLMANNKKTNNKKFRLMPFETMHESGIKSTTANITRSMLYSDAFLALNLRQRMLYVYMKSEYYGKPKDDLKGFSAQYNDDFNGTPTPFFTFNWTKAKKAGYTSKKTFYDDVDELIEHGLIDCRYSGKNSRSKSLYMFSTRWRKYGTQEFKTSNFLRTTSGVKKYGQSKT